MSTMIEAEARPSNVGKLEECIHFRSDGLPVGPAADRGTRINQLTDILLAGEPIGSWRLEEAPEVAAATWVAEEAKKALLGIQTQKKLQLWDLFVTPAELIMQGTCDILGRNQEDELLEVWDIKSGRYRDYSMQLMCYALMAMDELGEVECRIRAAFCDERVFQESVVTRGDCEERIFGLVERIRIGVELPQENEYCGSCARQSVCPVWVVPAEETLMIMNPDMTPLLDPALTPQSRLELLKKNPPMLGKFIDGWRKLQKLIEKSDIEGFAKELILSGTPVPGWRVSEAQGRSFYDKEQITKILSEWGESAADFLSVNRERYEGACANSDNDCIEPAGRNKPILRLLKDNDSKAIKASLGL
jgi:PD-(D/E)XK nuclease superfamily